MNACVENFSVFADVPSPSWLRPVMTAKAGARTPAQEQLGRRLQPYIASVIAALEDATDSRQAATVEVDAVMKLGALLPADMPVVESYVTSSGSLCFDWDEDPRNQFSIILQAGGRIAYAGYFDGDRVNGSSRFGAALPRDLASTLERWKERNAF